MPNIDDIFKHTYLGEIWQVKAFVDDQIVVKIFFRRSISYVVFSQAYFISIKHKLEFVGAVKTLRELKNKQ